MRKIVVLQPREWLRESSAGKLSTSDLGDRLGSETKASGFFLRENTQAVVLPPMDANLETLRTVTTVAGTELPHSYAVAAEFENDEAEQDFVERSGELVEGVFADLPIAPFATVCPNSAVGVPADVLTATKMSAVHARGHEGMGTKIVVVDTGIDGTQVNVSGGWTLYPGAAPGTAAPDHGTMVAWDAQLMAPNAAIWDCPLLQSTGAGFVAFLSDAILAYGQILASILSQPGTWILVNSWGLYKRALDAPVGHPQNYARNPRHPFNQIVGAVVGSGADVVFAAGNCGAACPSTKCGTGDVGPGKSIHGANSHPDVISVAAVTVQDDRLGYSSQGPGGLSARTPDLSAPSHFDGAGVAYSIHSGTSAACPVVGGAIASLRSKSPAARKVTPAALKTALLTTARRPGGGPPTWDADYGNGILDADAAWAALP